MSTFGKSSERSPALLNPFSIESCCTSVSPLFEYHSCRLNCLFTSYMFSFNKLLTVSCSPDTHFDTVLNAVIINVILSVTLVPCEVVFIEAWSLVLCCIVSSAEVVLSSTLSMLLPSSTLVTMVLLFLFSVYYFLITFKDKSVGTLIPILNNSLVISLFDHFSKSRVVFPLSM